MRHLRDLQLDEEAQGLSDSARHSRRSAVVGAVVALVGALLLASDLPLCPVAALSGYPCPGCGLTRATLALLSGQWAAALRYHPLVMLVLPALGLAAVGTLGPRRLGERGERLRRWRDPGAALLLALLLGVWLARFAGYLGGPAAVSTPLWR